MSPEQAVASAVAIIGAIGGAWKVIEHRRKRNGNGKPHVLTPELAKHIDERAEHKARNVVHLATMQVEVLRRDVDALKTDASGRFDAIEAKVDGLSDNVSDLRGYLRGKLGE